MNFEFHPSRPPRFRMYCQCFPRVSKLPYKDHLFFNFLSIRANSSHCNTDIKYICFCRYHSLAPMYYRGAQAAIVVYDITNQVRVLTFTKLSAFLEFELCFENFLLMGWKLTVRSHLCFFESSYCLQLWFVSVTDTRCDWQAVLSSSIIKHSLFRKITRVAHHLNHLTSEIVNAHTEINDFCYSLDYFLLNLGSQLMMI